MKKTTLSTNVLVKPFLKWAGGKRQLLPEIRSHIPSFRTYYEPFMGAGAVLFDLQPQRAVAGDYNHQLIKTYLAVKENVDKTCSLLQMHKEKYAKEYFYAIRELDRNVEAFSRLSLEEIAARFIFLNRTCYNGLYRVNSRGFFNVPFGQYKKPVINDEETLNAVSDYFNRHDVILRHGDFEDTIDGVRRDDFVYFDPPYHSETKLNFTSYQAGGFSEDEQLRLQQCYSRLTRKGVKCLLSNSDTQFIRDLYKDFTIMVVPAKRLINTNAQGRGFVNELLIKNW